VEGSVVLKVKELPLARFLEGRSRLSLMLQPVMPRWVDHSWIFWERPDHEESLGGMGVRKRGEAGHEECLFLCQVPL